MHLTTGFTCVRDGVRIPRIVRSPARRASMDSGMALHELDNPFWASLRTRHAPFAIGDGQVMRYPAEIAPFLGIRDDLAGRDAPALFETIAAMVAPDESVYLIGPVPGAAPGWRLHAYRPLAQMVCDNRAEVADGPDIVPLDERHHADILALTALVYPHYFRDRTVMLGRYFGIYVDGRLVAMIGERLGTHTTREMSAICTHPDFLGRGYAARLTAMLTNMTLDAGLTPFLHVSRENPRAFGLYERLGYRVRADVPFHRLRRVG